MRKLILVMAAAAMGFAQNTSAPAPPPPAALAPGEVVRVVDLKQATAGSVYYTLRTIFPGISQYSENRLVVRGPVAVVDMIEEAIRKLDSPAPEASSVELTFQLLQGSLQEGKGGPIPNELESTVRQLRTLFPYKSYKMLDTQIFRGRSGKSGGLDGTLPGGSDTFNLYVSVSVDAGPAPQTVRMSELRFGVTRAMLVDGKTQYGRSNINTSFDAREGQKTVVGKSNITGTDDAIVLVVTPKVMD